MARFDDEDRKVTRETVVRDSSSSANTVTGIVAVLAIAVLAVGGWFLLNDKPDTPTSVGVEIKQGASDAYNSTKDAASKAADAAKDAAAEVPQAASDAATKGDQDTTRPNKDDSTGNLDQK